MTGLAGSISEIGLLHPIVVTPDGILVAGERRLAACRKLGWDAIPVSVIDLAEIVRGEFAENAIRKDFLPTEYVAIKRTLEPVVAAPAGRPKKGVEDRGAPLLGEPLRAPPLPMSVVVQTQKEITQTLGNFRRPSTSQKVASYVGVSHATLEKAEVIVKAAEADHRYVRRGFISQDVELLALFDRASRRNVGTNQHSEPVDNVHGLPKTRPTGNAAQTVLRRLEKDAAKGNERATRMLEDVLADKISPHAAAIAMGYRKPTVTIRDDFEAIHDAAGAA